MFLIRDETSANHTETTTKLKKPAVLLGKGEYGAAGKQFLIIWQDVETQKQNLYSRSTFVSWNLDMAINNGASVLIKELEELGISLIRDAAVAFYLAAKEDFKKENIRRYLKRDRESSPWPKLGSEITYNEEPIGEGTAIDFVFEDLKHPIDALLEKCTTNRGVAEKLGYYYFVKRGACNIEGYYSADVECIIGQGLIDKEDKQGMLKHALQRASGNKDIGNEEWIRKCLNKLGDS
ncbi:hypothetical protein O988_00205 [Pseudogymnoascus sp. VKM F-3808]|nr:hypothetical protein O988_00205 [Pseudogymnoascus sp. VKM F-3808]